MMKTASDSTIVAVPPALLAEVEAAALDEHRPVADVLREVIEQGLGERRWKARAEQELRRARELGLPLDDQPMTDEYRKAIHEKIATGLRSLGDGRGSDGEAFFSEIYAELDELERQGH